METVRTKYIDAADSYLTRLCSTLGELPREPFVQLAEQIIKCYKNSGTVFVIGNGGSASTASHLVSDLQKTVLKKNYKVRKRIKALSLSDNVPVLTAWANDYGYEHIFSEQLTNLAKPGDLLVVITGSGNSSNIINALKTARKLKVSSFGLLGFDGGAAKKHCDNYLLVAKDHYGVVEDVHSITGHLLTELIILMYPFKHGK